MRLSVLLALVAVTSGIRINADPEPEVAPKKKGPFDKSDAEERIEKLSFGYEKAAILKDQHLHPNATDSAEKFAATEPKPDRAKIINEKKFFTDNEDHIKKSDHVEAKAVQSIKDGVYTWGTTANDVAK